MGLKDVHLADCVSKPELLWGDIFLFIIIILNLAVFSFGGSGVLCTVLHGCRQLRPRAAGKLFLWLLACASSAPAEATSLEWELRGWVGRGWGTAGWVALGPGRQGGWYIQLPGNNGALTLACPLPLVRVASGEWEDSSWRSIQTKGWAHLSALCPPSQHTPWQSSYSASKVMPGNATWQRSIRVGRPPMWSFHTWDHKPCINILFLGWIFNLYYLWSLLFSCRRVSQRSDSGSQGCFCALGSALRPPGEINWVQLKERSIVWWA